MKQSRSCSVVEFLRKNNSGIKGHHRHCFGETDTYDSIHVLHHLLARHFGIALQKSPDRLVDFGQILVIPSFVSFSKGGIVGGRHCTDSVVRMAWNNPARYKAQQHGSLMKTCGMRERWKGGYAALRL